MEFENLPEGWGKDKLINLTTKIGSGATPKGGSDVYLENGEIALIRSQNIYNLSFSPDGLAYIEQNQANKLANVEVKKNDVLLNITGDSVARVCLVPESFLPARVNQHVAILRTDSEKLNARYLQYFLVGSTMQMHMLNLSSAGATRKALTKGMIEDFTIPIPPLPQQQKIASILGALDDKIELNNQMNQTLGTMAKALFNSWFVDFEPFSNGEFEQSELGMIPKGWCIGTLGNLLQQIRKAAKVGKDTENKPYVPIDCINSKQIALTQYKDWQEAQSSLIKFEKNDILFGAMRPYFHKVALAPFDGITRTTCFVLRPENLTDLSFCLIKVFDDQTIDYANRHSAGSTMPYAVWENGLANMPIIIPSDDARKEFHRQVFPLLERIRDSIFEIQNLTTIRDTLLPKLMSGELNLNERLN